MGLFVALALVSLLCILCVLLASQSKKPSGILGKWMMGVWNKAYLPMAEWALACLPRRNPKEVLDIGMGNGASTCLLANRYPDATVLGIDISSSAVAQAAHKNPGKNIAYRTADVCTLDVPPQSVDLATAFQTHFHWQNFEQALAQLLKSLSPGGHLLLACEKNKLPIYLKQYQTPEAVQQYARKTGYTEFHYFEKGGWCAFLLQA